MLDFEMKKCVRQVDDDNFIIADCQTGNFYGTKSSKITIMDLNERRLNLKMVLRIEEGTRTDIEAGFGKFDVWWTTVYNTQNF